MLQVRFGYSTNPKAIIVKGEDTINSLCAEHSITVGNSIVNHNGLPLTADQLSTPFMDLNIQTGDSIIIVTKTNAA